MNLKEHIEIIEGFPKEGISFKNINTLLKTKDGLRETIDRIAENLKDKKIDYIVGPEARGFIVGTAVGYALNVGFIPVRKPGKLPGEVESYEYDLEYGKDLLQIQKNAFEKGARIAIVDDLLATGGTVNAAAKLIEKMGGKVVSMQFIIELTELKGREKNKEYHVQSLVEYDI